MSSQAEEKFSSFFLIKHPVSVNLLPASDAEANYSQHEFEQQMPYAFKISAEMSEIESQALKPLRGLGDKLKELVDYLQLQAQKIDLMMSYILLTQDQAEYRFEATKFGGGGLIVAHEQAVAIGSARIIKIFLESEAAAVYCFGQAIKCEQVNDHFEVSYVYTHIREADQELLVRASLHLQTAQLRKRDQ